MRQYKFDKPLVESTFPPQDVNTYWVDVDESTRKLLTIKEFSQADGEWKTTMRMPDYYLVNITLEGEGATLVCDKPWYKAGDAVTLTATVEEDYEIEDLAASWAGGDITLTEEDDNIWSFEMPAGDVQAAGRAGKNKKEQIILRGKVDDMLIDSLSCTGDIVISSIKNGQPVSAQYNNLENTEISIQSDGNTDIVISGVVTKLEMNGNDNYDALESIDTSSAISIQHIKVKLQILESLDLSNNSKLINLDCSNNNNLTSLILPNGSNLLTSLDCGDCETLTSLDLSHSVTLTSLRIGNCFHITTIKYSATNSSVSSTIANFIADEDSSSSGTVYTDSDGAYYSTIANAATTKGWTIEQLPA